MNARPGNAVRALGITLLIAAAMASGCGVLSNGSQDDVTGLVASVSPATPEAMESPAAESDRASLGYAGSAGSADTAAVSQPPGQDALVITNASMNVEVKDLDGSVEAVRAIAAKYGASIQNLSVNAGSESPVPLSGDGSSADYAVPTPGGASITLRVPSERLPAAEKELAALGRVISQSSSQDDVTQQHVDLKARLKNLQAEEARLRTFFLKATRVSEMLAIEQELSRVRGDIESMQAQITYLERQAALATLTVSLSQPGTLVSPAAGGWGFSAAIRDGVRAAAAVLRGLITTILALSPLILLGILLFALIRTLVVRRRKRMAAQAAEPEASAPESAE